MTSSVRRGSAAGRSTSRGNTDLGVLFILLAAALLAIAMVIAQLTEESRCEERGGVFYCAYKSSCLCLAKGTVLP